MRYLKLFVVGLLLSMPVLATADAEDLPGSAVWYFHIDLEQMRKDGPGQGVYAWLQDEAFTEIKDEAGIDVGKELDSLTAFDADCRGRRSFPDQGFGQDLLSFFGRRGRQQTGFFQWRYRH
jgi:hypothetical protein